MILYKATYENTCPECPEKVERIFYMKENAKRWLDSFPEGNYIIKILDVKQFDMHGIIKTKTKEEKDRSFEELLNEVRNYDK